MSEQRQPPQAAGHPPCRQRLGRRLGAVALAVLAFLPAACGAQGPAPGDAAAPWRAVTDQDGPDQDSPDQDAPDQDTVEQDGAGAAPLTVGPQGFGQYLAGRQAQAAADVGAAADFYSAALAADPTNVTLARRAYFFLLAAGRMDDGLRLAQRTLDLDPRSTVAPLVLAAGASARQDFAGAEAILSTVDLRGLNSFMVPLMRAWTLAGEERIDDALAALAPMGKHRQFAQMHDFHRGLILDLAGRNAEAWAAYRKTLEDKTPLSLRTAEVVANFLRRQGRSDEAYALVDRYRAEHPDSLLVDAAFRDFTQDGPVPPRPVGSARDGMAEALYGAASSVMQTSALDTALVFARLALLQRPEFPYAWLMIGDILLNQGRFAEATEIYRAIPPDSAIRYPVQLRLSEALAAQDRFDEAEALLTDLAKAYPETPDAPVALGDLLRRQEKWAAAAAAYQEGVDRLTGAEDKRHWALFYSLGVALERAGRWDAAEAVFLHALDLEPDQPLVLNYLGYSWIDRGEHLDKGKELIEAAVRQRPTDGYIVDSMGWVHYLLGDYAKAVEELERAIELAPADPTINDHLGDAYWRVGRHREARFQWQRALTLDPEPEMAETIGEKLETGLAGRQPLGEASP
jgi:tetratricopeptide (TPR) repeat protein